ncbi:hypothetical protein NLU13_0753 [Sarocladium strictum]|uniref:Uncharacterized protein n=1 Tax=Sarocladium strictum TaxID=5046 RepID=A0AA39GPM8_SARSR|nr:hypothetical protein NLU13_0753 [Sarocladium strictum]
MPIPLAAKGAAVAVTVAVAAAIALYESPELRRYADDLRRRIAIAVNGVSDGFRPQQSREPVFNRPEDASGFLLSRRGEGAEPGVEADEETRRRQREELMYWNSVMLEKQRKEAAQGKPDAIEGGENRPAVKHRGSSFDDFLTKDKNTNAEQGAFVFNSGADTKRETEGLRHRGEVNRGLATALLANPFADEFGIGNDELVDQQTAEVIKGRDEILSDIYSATTRDHEDSFAEAKEEPVPALIDISEEPVSRTESAASHIDYDMAEAGPTTPRSEDQEEAYASIQAWAQDAAQNQSAPTPSFYSPLPVTPMAPVSEPEVISEGQLTPTDSMSIIGSGEDYTANEAQAAREAGTSEGGRPYDVLSESEGMLTPASWSEIGSVVSDTEGPTPMRS